MNADLPLPVLQASAHWETVDFISDLHLQADEPATFAAWLRYLETTPAQAVFMLGDLFEVWVGDDVVSPRLEDSLFLEGEIFESRCARVMQFAASRLDLFFMRGNRDFLVGPQFLSLARTRLLPDPTVLDFQGQRWLLTHGDALCLADEAYMQFRQQVRGLAWQQDFLARPLQERQAIARGLREGSEARKRQTGVWADVDNAAALGWLQRADANVMIHGHTHQPAEHELDSTHRRVVLSDWDLAATPARAQVLRLQGQTLERISLA